MSLPEPDIRTFRFGMYEVDTSAGELRKCGRKIKLQEQPFQILAALLDRPGEIVSRDDLRRRLWQEDTFVEFHHSLNTAMGRLRDALDDSAENPRFIETLPRRGYRLIAPVERVNGEGPLRNGRGSPAPVPTPVVATVPAADPFPSLWRNMGVAPVLVAAIGVSLYWLRDRCWGAPKAQTRKIMLTALPFQNLSGDPKQDFASDAMTEEMITHLGRMAPQSLGLIARTSVMKQRKYAKPWRLMRTTPPGSTSWLMLTFSGAARMMQSASCKKR